MIADDDPYARMVIRDALERAGAIVIAEARDGRQAVELTLQHQPRWARTPRAGARRHRRPEQHAVRAGIGVADLLDRKNVACEPVDGSRTGGRLVSYAASSLGPAWSPGPQQVLQAPGADHDHSYGTSRLATDPSGALKPSLSSADCSDWV